MESDFSDDLIQPSHPTGMINMKKILLFSPMWEDTEESFDKK